jgi:hypothetical protein
MEVPDENHAVRRGHVNDQSTPGEEQFHTSTIQREFVLLLVCVCVHAVYFTDNFYRTASDSTEIIGRK